MKKLILTLCLFLFQASCASVDEIDPFKYRIEIKLADIQVLELNYLLNDWAPISKAISEYVGRLEPKHKFRRECDFSNININNLRAVAKYNLDNPHRPKISLKHKNLYYFWIKSECIKNNSGDNVGWLIIKEHGSYKVNSHLYINFG